MVIFRDAMRHKQRGVENRNKWEGERRWRETGRDREQSRREQPLAAEEMSWLGFSEVVNQEHQHVRAFKEEPERNWEKVYDQLWALQATPAWQVWLQLVHRHPQFRNRVGRR